MAIAVKERPGREPGPRPNKVKKLVHHGYWWWSLPALAAILSIHYVATGVGFMYSFTDYEGIGEFNWIGLENYTKIFEDEEVSGAIYNTFFLAILSFVLSNVIGLMLALALNRGLKTRYLLRTLLFLPVILSTIAVSYIFRFIFYIEGPINTFLASVGLGEFQKTWLADTTWSIWVILLVVVWQNIGFAMVIYLAGLATVPQELEEAAAIDGAGVWRRFTSVTIPMIQPAIAVSTTLALIQGMKIFDQVIAMTGGGPFGATDTLSTIIYNKTFVYMEYGYGSSISLVFTVVILLMALLQTYLTRDRSGAKK
ncbi:MAG: Lactose transport system permease protein LacF [Actinomycetota bacterium]|jgi:raffinose/stachyose/melibiose transport system permease protein